MPARVFPRDQRCQLERVGQADPPELAGHAFGNREIPHAQSVREDRVRSSRRGRRASSAGPDGRASLRRAPRRQRPRRVRQGQVLGTSVPRRSESPVGATTYGKTFATAFNALLTLPASSVIAPITAIVITASTTPYSAIV